MSHRRATKIFPKKRKGVESPGNFSEKEILPNIDLICHIFRVLSHKKVVPKLVKTNQTKLVIENKTIWAIPNEVRKFALDHTATSETLNQNQEFHAWIYQTTEYAP